MLSASRQESQEGERSIIVISDDDEDEYGYRSGKSGGGVEHWRSNK